eukprot:4311820-Prymnesium_polylepis.1
MATAILGEVLPDARPTRLLHPESWVQMGGWAVAQPLFDLAVHDGAAVADATGEAATGEDATRRNAAVPRCSTSGQRSWASSCC